MMNMIIIKNDLGTYDIYRVEDGRRYYICTCETKSQALGLKEDA